MNWNISQTSKSFRVSLSFSCTCDLPVQKFCDNKKSWQRGLFSGLFSLYRREIWVRN